LIWPFAVAFAQSSSSSQQSSLPFAHPALRYCARFRSAQLFGALTGSGLKPARMAFEFCEAAAKMKLLGGRRRLRESYGERPNQGEKSAKIF